MHNSGENIVKGSSGGCTSNSDAELSKFLAGGNASAKVALDGEALRFEDNEEHFDSPSTLPSALALASAMCLRVKSLFHS